jgi:hypothetical protein
MTDARPTPSPAPAPRSPIAPTCWWWGADRPVPPPRYWLAKAGHRVVCVERKVFPRDKTCGDGLTPGP